MRARKEWKKNERWEFKKSGCFCLCCGRGGLFIARSYNCLSAFSALVCFCCCCWREGDGRAWRQQRLPTTPTGAPKEEKRLKRLKTENCCCCYLLVFLFTTSVQWAQENLLLQKPRERKKYSELQPEKDKHAKCTADDFSNLKSKIVQTTWKLANCDVYTSGNTNLHTSLHPVWLLRSIFGTSFFFFSC